MKSTEARRGLRLVRDERRLAYRKRVSSPLPKRAFAICECLFEKFESPIEVETLKKRYWADKGYVTDHTINTNISSIRSALRGIDVEHVIVERANGTIKMRYERPRYRRNPWLAAAVVCASALVLLLYLELVSNTDNNGLRMQVAEPLLTGLRTSRSLAISPDRQLAAFVGHQGTDDLVVLRNLETGETEELLRSPIRIADLVWLADGNRLALSILGGICRVYVVDLQRNRPTLVGPCATYSAGPFPGRVQRTVDALGSTVTFLQMSDRGSSTVDIVGYNVPASGEIAELWRFRPEGKPHEVRLSPDGRHIAYVSTSVPGSAQLILAATDDGFDSKELLGVRDGSIHGLAWLDDRRIFVIGTEFGERRIRVFDLKSETEASVRAADGFALMSPVALDDHTVYLERSYLDQAIAQISFVEEGASLRVIEDSTGQDVIGDYNSTADSIVFSSDRGSHWAVYEKSLASSEIRELATNVSSSAGPVYTAIDSVAWMASSEEDQQGLSVCRRARSAGSEPTCATILNAESGEWVNPRLAPGLNQELYISVHDPGGEPRSIQFALYRIDGVTGDVSGTGYNARFPKALPDDRIVYSTRPGAASAIVGERADGSDFEQSVSPVDLASWDSDGEILAYIERRRNQTSVVLRRIKDDTEISRYTLPPELSIAQGTRMLLDRNDGGATVFLSVVPAPKIDIVKYQLSANTANHNAFLTLK